MNQLEILKLKRKQLELQKEDILRKINNLTVLSQQIDTKITRLTEQESKLSSSINEDISVPTESTDTSDLNASSIFSQM
jgi:hypothetical protein